MERILIAADSTSDLSEELIERYGIEILPLHVGMGDGDYHDGVDVTPEDIYKWSDETGMTPKTAAPSPEEARSFIEKCLKKAEEVICFTISSEMSSCFNIIRSIAEEFGLAKRFHTVDSANLSTGIGLLVTDAGECVKRGLACKDILLRIREIIPRVRASFVVDTLVFLHRGGRCSGLAAMLGGALKLHPSIVVADGVMHPDKKYRGNLGRVVMAYVRDMEEKIKGAIPDRVFVTHSGVDKKIVSEVIDYLKGLGKFGEVLETRAGCVVSSHCGPGTLGVLFISGE